MLKTSRGSARVRRPALLCVGTSLAALAIGLAGPAAAQCVSTVANGITTTDCTGTVGDGLTVATSQQRVTIARDARLLAGTNAAALRNTASYTSLTVAGAVDGGATPGILVRGGDLVYIPYDPYAGAAVPVWPYPAPGTPVPSYTYASTTISVSEGATIMGSTGIQLTKTSGTLIGNGGAEASIDNAGTITAAAGPAMVAGTGASFRSVVNRATGTIGGIAGELWSLSNQGVIDGGSGAAVAGATGSVTSLTATNSGTIRSNGSAATLTASGGYLSLTNSGTIRNAGSGAAIAGPASLSIVNQAGGTIGSGGAVAIQATRDLSLSNDGRIEGSVIGTTDPLYRNYVATANGTIQGDVLFAGGNDTLIAHYDAATGRIDSITGRIDLGGGENSLGLAIDADATLSRAALPANFAHLTVSLQNDATVSIGSDFSGLGDLGGSGRGRIINNADLTVGNAAYVAAILTNGTTTATGSGGLDVDNRAAITSNAQFTAAVIVNSGSLQNSGSIASSRTPAVTLSDYGYGSAAARRALTNSGTITGATSGATLYNADLLNSGTITGTVGSGASISAPSYGTSGGTGSVNTGTITGATSGVFLSYARLANSGTISGGTAGITADSGVIDNGAGGVISGAIGIDGRNGSNVRVRNAGTIQGGVRFDGSYSYGGGHVFVDAGGTVNGDLLFGQGNDLLVVALDTAAARPLAGVTGRIDAGNGTDTLRYSVAADATTTVAAQAGFERVAYEVTGGARLTLGAGAWNQALGLVGTGTVDLNTDITTARAALDLTASATQSLLAGTALGSDIANANAGLTVISRGTIVARALATDYSSYDSSCAVSVGGASFQNLGTISATSAPDGYGGAAICAGNGTITNSGTIRLAGTGTVVSGGASLINTGLITDSVGGNSSGVFVQTLVNSGTILTEHSAFGGSPSGGGSVTNSGRLESRASAAVLLSGGDMLVNATGGVIKGAGVAVSGAGAMVTNRGSIEGDVALGTDWWYRTNNRYVADGGTIAGDLIFGAGDDVFVQSAAATGVRGTIDGGAGVDTIVLAGTGAGTFDGAFNFERLSVDSGSWTLATPANFSLGTTIASAATLIGTTGTLLGTITDNGTLEIAQDFDGQFLARLAGAGTLAKSGTGTVTLAAQPDFTGTVRVLGGGLSFDGDAGFALAISNGTFTGTGRIAALSLGAGGVVSPGGTGAGTASALALSPRAAPMAVATLNVTGDFAQAAGSTYLATIAADGRSDRIVVGGSATIATGARLQLVGTRAGIGTRYTLLTAAGGIAGGYTSIDQAPGDTELRLAYAANSLFADVVRSRTGLVGIAASGNQRAAATGLASLGTANAAYAAVTTLADDGATRAGLGALSGEAHASLRAASVQDAQLVEATLRSHLRDPVATHGVWGSYLSGNGTNDGSDDAGKTHRSTLGGIAGIDRSFGTVRLGLGGGYTRTRLGAAGLSREAEARTVHLFGAAAGQIGPVGLNAGIGFGWTSNRIDRQVAVAEFADKLRADYDATIAHGFAEAQHAIPLGGGRVTPFLGIEAYRQRADAFRETGGAAALSGAARGETFAFARTGLRLETPIAATLAVRADGAWVRRIAGMAPDATLRFAGGDAFRVRGTPLSRDAATAELAAVWAPVRTMRITAGYAGTIGSRGDDNGFRLTAMLGF